MSFRPSVRRRTGIFPRQIWSQGPSGSASHPGNSRFVLLSQVTQCPPQEDSCITVIETRYWSWIPVRLTESIAKAQKAIEQRLELTHDRVDAGWERQALDDALQNLSVLARDNKNGL